MNWSGSERQPTCLADGDLNRRRWQRRIELTLRQQRRLCHEARPFPAVRLRGMNKEWVAQIDGAYRTDCRFDLAIFCGSVTIGRELLERRACVARVQMP